MATTRGVTASRTIQPGRPLGRSVVREHLAELIGLALACAGIALLIALVSYDSHDPSLNTSSTRETHNLVGPAGAVVADLLLQSFGCAAVLPGLTMLVWAWRLVSRRGMGSVAVRLASLLAAIPAWSMVLASITPRGVTWPTMAGFGGASGGLLSDDVLNFGARLAGPTGAALMWLIGTGLAALLTIVALGLSVSEWRSAGRMARRAARATAHGGRSGWRWMGFGLRLPKLPKFSGLPPVLLRERNDPAWREPLVPDLEPHPEYTSLEPEPVMGHGGEHGVERGAEPRLPP